MLTEKVPRYYVQCNNFVWTWWFDSLPLDAVISTYRTKWPEMYYSNSNRQYRNLSILRHLHKRQLCTQKSVSFQQMMRLKCKTNKCWKKIILGVKYIWLFFSFFYFSPINGTILSVQKSNTMQIATIHKITKPDGELVLDLFWVANQISKEFGFKFRPYHFVSIGLRTVSKYCIFCPHFNSIFLLCFQFNPGEWIHLL